MDAKDVSALGLGAMPQWRLADQHLYTSTPPLHVLEIPPETQCGAEFTFLECGLPVKMTLVREMPVLTVARFIGITDKRLWQIVEHYVAKALRGLDVSSVVAYGFDAVGVAFRPPRGATIPRGPQLRHRVHQCGP